MIKKWSIRYPAVGGEEERRAYVYLPRAAVSGAVYVRRAERIF